MSEFAKRTKGLENIDLRGCIQVHAVLKFINVAALDSFVEVKEGSTLLSC